jgi:prepilin-type N-terminal cleavage/methylation domain-containing protein
MSQRGMTMVEILIVLVIIGAITGMAITKFNTHANNIKTVSRDIAGLAKEIHYSARLSQKTFRLVMQLGDEKHTDQYWVESSNKPGAVIEAYDDKYDKDKAPPSAFQPDPMFTKKPVELPKGLFFEDVELAARDQVIKSGRAYIHFTPQGLTEQAAIHLTDKKELHWSLLVHPLTGGVTVEGRYVSLKDVNKR